MKKQKSKKTSEWGTQKSKKTMEWGTQNEEQKDGEEWAVASTR